MGAALTYEVARPFKDEVGQLSQGDMPKAARVNGWKNLQVLLDMGYLSVRSTDQVVTGPAATELVGSQTVAPPKAKAKAKPKAQVKTAPAAQLCPKCGKGPFKKLAVHMMHKHKE